MAGSIDALVRDLRDFERRGEVVKQLRKEIRKPVPAVRKAIKARALSTMPSGGGLNVWVASTRITAAITVTRRMARVRLKGGRNSAGGRSDMRAINRGRLRHPSWGRRGPGQWHTQAVAPEFFTKPAAEAKEWREAIDRAIDSALDTIRMG